MCFKQSDKIIQFDKRLNRFINAEGCHFRSILGMSETYLQKCLSVQDISDIYENAKIQNIILNDCDVLKPDALLNLGFIYLGAPEYYGYQIGQKLSGQESVYWGWVENKRCDASILRWNAIKTPEHYTEGNNELQEIWNPGPNSQVTSLISVIFYQIHKQGE